MLNFSEYTPNLPGVALLYAQILDNLDRPTARAERRALMDQLLGAQHTQQIVASPAFPVTWTYAYNTDTTFFGLSGTRTAQGLRDVAAGYLDSANSSRVAFFNKAIQDYADSLLAEFDLRTSADRGKIVIAGHSLGGAMGTVLAWRFATRYPRGRIYLCTFGQPKLCGEPTFELGAATFARWTNPLDNVPSLPPLYDRASLLYSTLTRAQQVNLTGWRHPCQALSISETGQTTTIDDPPSAYLTFTTILQTIQSREGMFGTGHALDRYIANFNGDSSPGAQGGASWEPISQTPGIPGAQPPPYMLTPRIPPVPPTPATMTARLDVFREEATNNDGLTSIVPFPNLPVAVYNGKVWVLRWMEYDVAVCPTKKKARALARHMNRFLRIFQGVGQCCSRSFVSALSDYLLQAAAPEGEFLPRLQDAGEPPVIIVP